VFCINAGSIPIRILANTHSADNASLPSCRGHWLPPHVLLLLLLVLSETIHVHLVSVLLESRFSSLSVIQPIEDIRINAFVNNLP